MRRIKLVILCLLATAPLTAVIPAYASGECSVSSLKGAYSFSARGELLGILDTTKTPPVLDPLTKPIFIDGVALQTFDGNFVEVGNPIFLGNRLRMVFFPARQKLPAQPGIFINF